MSPSDKSYPPELAQCLREIDDLRQFFAKRRLVAAEQKELNAWYRVELTYASNALEGNSLSLTETKVLLEDGITPNGKPFRESCEAAGHAAAYDFMLTLTEAEPFSITEETVRKLHFLFYNKIDSEAAGQYRKHPVLITGTEYVPPVPEQVPELMREFIAELGEKSKTLHPVRLAAFAHRRLADIHPFTDGNGRTARLLMNLILVHDGYCIVSIPPALRMGYIGALRTAQREKNQNIAPFEKLIAECELEAQRDYCRMFRIPIKGTPEIER